MTQSVLYFRSSLLEISPLFLAFEPLFYCGFGRFGFFAGFRNFQGLGQDFLESFLAFFDIAGSVTILIAAKDKNTLFVEASGELIPESHLLTLRNRVGILQVPTHIDLRFSSVDMLATGAGAPTVSVFKLVQY